MQSILNASLTSALGLRCLFYIYFPFYMYLENMTNFDHLFLVCLVCIWRTPGGSSVMVSLYGVHPCKWLNKTLFYNVKNSIIYSVEFEIRVVTLELVQRSKIESSLKQFSLFYQKQKDWINFPLDFCVCYLSSPSSPLFFIDPWFSYSHQNSSVRQLVIRERLK